MEEIRHIFPNFVPNQVLTSGQLNALREYLDQQDRLGRIRLGGTGIVCGLSIERSGESGPVTVAGGFGISSDGYLIEHPGGRYSHCRDYVDPGNDADGLPGYLPWRRRPARRSQIPLLELLESKQEDGDRALTAKLLEGRVVILYLEMDEEEMRSCLVTDCNNNGARVRLTPRLLLAREEDLDRLDDARAAPRPVELPRLHAVMPLTAIKSAAVLNDGYRTVIESVLPELTAALRVEIGRYGSILPVGARPNDPVRPFERMLKRAIGKKTVDQYHYDLVADVVTAFNEFILQACRWIPDCQPATDHPRHLMLDHVEGAGRFRHLFRPAAIRSHWQEDGRHVASLLRRLLALLENASTDAAGKVRITPSHDEREPLGARAIPHYFNPTQEVRTCWRPDDHCNASPPWSYHREEEDIERDYRRCSLLRIEGHLGRSGSDGHFEISRLRRRHNAEFDLLLLHLERADDGRENALLESLAAARAERARAEEAMELLLDESLGAAAFPREPFVYSYSEKAEAVRRATKAMEERRREMEQLRSERRLSCSLAHLEADYGALRAEILSLLHHLSNALEAAVRQYAPPPMRGASRERLKQDIEAAAKNLYSLADRIEAEQDEAKRRELLARRFAVESEKINLEAEEALRLRARKSAPAVIAKNTWLEPGSAERIADAVAGEIERLRAGRAEHMVQLVEQVTVAGLKRLLERLMAQLPERLAALDLDDYMALFKRLVSDLIELRLNTLVKRIIALSRSGMGADAGAASALGALAESLKLEEQDLQHMLLSVTHDSRQSRLVYLYHLYRHHLAREGRDFAGFAQRHPGMEHLAGVAKGGTFILVAESDAPDAKIVADFALHGKVPCCCRPPDRLHLPPVAMPDYRIVPLHWTKDRQGYAPVELEIDLLRNDFGFDAGKGADGGERYAELPSEISRLGARLRLDRSARQVSYRIESAMPGAVDRFEYRLKLQDGSGEDRAQVLILFVSTVGHGPQRPHAEDGPATPPERQPLPEGNLAVQVVDAVTKEPIEAAILTLFDAGEKRVAQTDRMAPDGRYRLEGIASGDYSLRVQAGGYYPHVKKPIVIEQGVTTRWVAPLTARKNLFVPDDVVDYVSVKEEIDDDSAYEKIADAYAGRQADYLAAIAAAGKTGGVQESEAYARTDAFVTQALHDPGLSEEALARAYQALSGEVADAVNNAADDEEKASYRVLLENASKAFMDRLSLSNPERVTPESEAALAGVRSAVTAVGIDAGAMSEDWRGSGFGAVLDIGSADSVSALVKRG